MSSDDLRAKLDRHEPLVILDIRDAEEHAEWRIPGARHVDVYDALMQRDPAAFDAVVGLPKDAPIAVVCWQGNTSKLAQQALAGRGYDAYSVEGGMRGWSLAWNVAEVRPGVLQVRRTGKGCLSYMVASNGECAVIDPSVEPDVYLQLAKERGWRITQVLDTHVHADHLSRARALAERAGAQLHLPRTTRLKYDAHMLVDGDAVAVGEGALHVLATPGHTAESVCYQWGADLFTGDTLFLDSIGRPDLAASPEETRERARLLRASLARLLALAPDTVVLPGHVSAPIAFDGEALQARLGDVRERVTLAALPEAQFVETVLKRIPPTPLNHKMIVQLNERGEPFPGDPTQVEAGANRCALQ